MVVATIGGGSGIDTDPMSANFGCLASKLLSCMPRPTSGGRSSSGYGSRVLEALVVPVLVRGDVIIVDSLGAFFEASFIICPAATVAAVAA